MKEVISVCVIIFDMEVTCLPRPKKGLFAIVSAASVRSSYDSFISIASMA
jgi:hypothetical protein